MFEFQIFLERAMCIGRGVSEHELAKVGVAKITWPIQDIGRDGGSKIMLV